MKKTALTLAFSSLALIACEAQKAETPAEAATESPVSLDSEAQKQAYSIGANMGEYLNRQLQEQERLGIKLNQKLIVQGISDAMEGNSQLDGATIQSTLQSLQNTVQAKKQASDQAQGGENAAAGKAYLEQNAQRSEVTQTESGLQYEVLTAGEGAKPKATDTVTVHYHGTLIDGTVFDSSVDRGTPASFPLNRVISGWTEGVQLMPVGSKYRFHIPPELAYGGRSTGKIGPNSTLIFDVELLGIEE